MVEDRDSKALRFLNRREQAYQVREAFILSSSRKRDPVVDRALWVFCRGIFKGGS